MSQRRAAFLAWGLFIAACCLSATNLTLAHLSRNTLAPEEFSWTAIDTLDELSFLLYPLVGAVIAWKRPVNPIGWLFLGASVVQETTTLAANYGLYGLATDPGSLPAAVFATWYFEITWIIPTALLPLLFLIFPDGRLLSSRWRPVAWAVLIPILLVMVGVGIATWRFRGLRLLIKPESLSGLPAAESLVVPALFILLATFVASIVSVILRYRRSGTVQRLQLKWLGLAGFVLLLNLLDDFFISYTSSLRRLLGSVAFSLVPIAIGFAIFKHRLYDIDRLINKTLVYGALTAVLILGYALSILVVQALLPVSKDSPVVVAVSTLGMAALFGPLRARLQDAVDRRFYRSRYDVTQTVESFTARLRNETDLDTLSADLVGVVRQTLRPAHASLWLRSSPSDDWVRDRAKSLTPV